MESPAITLFTIIGVIFGVALVYLFWRDRKVTEILKRMDARWNMDVTNLVRDDQHLLNRIDSDCKLHNSNKRNTWTAIESIRRKIAELQQVNEVASPEYLEKRIRALENFLHTVPALKMYMPSYEAEKIHLMPELHDVTNVAKEKAKTFAMNFEEGNVKTLQEEEQPQEEVIEPVVLSEFEKKVLQEVSKAEEHKEAAPEVDSPQEEKPKLKLTLSAARFARSSPREG